MLWYSLKFVYFDDSNKNHVWFVIKVSIINLSSISKASYIILN